MFKAINFLLSISLVACMYCDMFSLLFSSRYFNCDDFYLTHGFFESILLHFNTLWDLPGTFLSWSVHSVVVREHYTFSWVHGRAGWTVLHKTKFRLVQKLSKSSVFNWVFYLLVPSIAERGMLKSATIVMYLSVSPLSPVCFASCIEHSVAG